MSLSDEINIDTSWYPLFLESFRQYANITIASEFAGVSRDIAIWCKEHDPKFASLWDSAFEEALDRVEYVATQRALSGSPMMIRMILVAKRPEVYGSKSDSSNASIRDKPIRQCSDDDLLEMLEEDERMRDQ
jgi:hypothetical protein